jgi:hypothetical protein
MKLREIYDELLTTAKNLGYVVRKENGSFHSGNCVLKEQKMIILNRNSPLEVLAGVVAKCFTEDILNSIYLKPAVREYIEKEMNINSGNNNSNFRLEINLSENNKKE